MKIEVGQRFDFEVDREDVELVDEGSIIATWYHMGNPIYVELSVNKSLISEIRNVFRDNKRKNVLISIFRVSQKKYVITPTVVLVNRQMGGINQIK